MDTMKSLMRYNNYKKEPYSRGNTMNTVCFRGDLYEEDPFDFGCIDTKV